MNNFLQAPKMDSVFDGRTDDIYLRAEQTSNQSESEKKALRIVNKTPLDFACTTETTLSTTTELAMQINEVFKPLFSDWHGSDVVIDGNGRVVINFVFRAVSVSEEANKSRAFLPINQNMEKSQNSTMNRISLINAVNDAKQRRMSMTEYGSQLIYDVMNNGIRHKMDAFKPETFIKQTSEIYEDAGFTGIQNIYNTVTGIDINKILGILFGTQDKENGHIIYGINPKRPVMANQMPGARTNFVVEIQRMTTRKFNEAMTKLGMIPMPGAITAITETASEAYHIK